MIEKEEIQKLLSKGFDSELISLELEIPLEKVKQYAREIKVSKGVKKANNTNSMIYKGSSKSDIKIKQIRERYKKLYFKVDNVENKPQKQLEQQEIDIINSMIETVENMIKGMKGLPKREKVKIASSVLEKMKNIEKYQLSIQQAEKLKSLIDSEELDNLNIKKGNDDCIKMERKRIIRKLAEAIDIKQHKIESIEELSELDRKLTLEMMTESTIIVGSVKDRISRKIQKIKQQEVSMKLTNDIPMSIIEIITLLANGTVNIEKASVIIEEEARKRVESRPKTKFTLTEEQEKRQILIKIKKTIIEKANQYNIENPEVVIEQMKQLFGESQQQCVITVTKNLIARKKFEIAKSICYKFFSKDKEAEATEYRILRNEIKNAEISDMILRVINMEGTDEEQNRCFELIEKGLERGNIKLGAISLGKSEDGSRTITLADIWEDKEEIIK